MLVIAFTAQAFAFQSSFAPMGALRTTSALKTAPQASKINMFDLDADNIGVTPPLGVFDPLGLI
jgi:hypothetical protein